MCSIGIVIHGEGEGGCSPLLFLAPTLVKDTLIRAISYSNEAHRVVKEAVYDKEANKNGFGGDDLFLSSALHTEEITEFSLQWLPLPNRK